MSSESSSFDPFGGPTGACDATVKGSPHICAGATAVGAPRVLIWEGRVAKRGRHRCAPARLLASASSTKPDAGAGFRAAIGFLRAGNPFTFALQHAGHSSAGACDGAPLWSAQASALTSAISAWRSALTLFGLLATTWSIASITSTFRHRWCRTSEACIFPPSARACTDLARRSARAKWRGKPIAASWVSLLAEPGPRYAVSAHMDAYRGLVEAAGAERADRRHVADDMPMSQSPLRAPVPAASDPAAARARRVAPNDMMALGIALLERTGASSRHARIVMEHLVASSAMGLHSHWRDAHSQQYLAEIETKIINPHAEPMVVQHSASRLSIDGQRGFGQVVGMLMVEALIPVARATGIAMINGYPSRPYRPDRRLPGGARRGRTREGSRSATVRRRDIGWRLRRSRRTHLDQSDRRRLASPSTRHRSWLISPLPSRRKASSASCAIAEAEAPEGYLRDAEGRPTRNPNVLYGVPKGAIQPLGGALGYRGTALALFVEVLTTMLNGDAVDDHARKEHRI